MSIRPVGAYKASDGTCHETKQAAYTADIVHFYRDLPRFDNDQTTARAFSKKVQEVAKWLEGAKALDEQMTTEQDVETKRSIVGQG